MAFDFRVDFGELDIIGPELEQDRTSRRALALTVTDLQQLTSNTKSWSKARSGHPRRRR